MKEFWENRLGFKPKKEIEEEDVKNICYNCESEDYEKLESYGWTSKRECNHCGYITEIIWSDNNGGNYNKDSVCTYKPKQL